MIFFSLSGYLDIVKILIENGANVTKIGSKGHTPLIRATAQGMQIIQIKYEYY